VAQTSHASTGVCPTELLAAMSLGPDLGMGQPMEHVLRQSFLAKWFGDGRVVKHEIGRSTSAVRS
jgi:hypothetical protein